MMIRKRFLQLMSILSAIILGASAFAQDEKNDNVPRIEPIIIQSATGQTILQAEIANTPQLREKGLMFRHHLAADGAMLFIFDGPTPIGMWMKNTAIPLDMLFINEKGEIINIAENTKPYSEEVLASQQPALAVLEVNAGSAQRLSLKPGDHILHHFFTSLH